MSEGANPGVLGVLAVLADGRPHTPVSIFRQLYHFGIPTRDYLPSGADGRLGPLRQRGWIEPVGDRANSFFLTEPGRRTLEAGVRSWDAELPKLVAQLVRAIEAEIGDARQARMFAENRLANTLALARETEGEPARAGLAQLLRVAIGERLRRLLASPRSPGHAFMKTVHDEITDYYYSRLMTLIHQDDRPRGIDVEGLALQPIAPGLRHGRLRTRSGHGPLFVNVLEVDPGVRRIAVEDVSSRQRPERYITSIAARTRALAVVSAGYFIYSEKGFAPPTRQFDPVGLCLVEGELRQPPVFLRGCLVVDPEGSVTYRRIGLSDLALVRDGAQHPIEAVNAEPPPGGLAAFNNVWGSEVMASAGELLVGVVNGRGIGTDQRRLSVPLNGFVLKVPASLAAESWAGRLDLGFRDPGLARARAAVAAGPMLVEQGRFAMNYAAEDFQEGTPPVTFSGDRTIDRNLIPRCGIGSRPDGTVVIAIVDGRQPHLSVGATLVEFAGLLSDLGVTTALNLDGGGTAAMQVGEEVVSNPSTSVRIDARGHAQPAASNEEKNVRPLATAITIH